MRKRIKTAVKIILFAFLFVGITLCTNRVGRRITRKDLRVPPSRSISESLERGAFMFEYEPSMIYIYDSICVRVKEAFVERFCWYKDYDSFEIRIDSLRQHPWIVILFDDDPWPGYYGDTVSFSTDELYINWLINGTCNCGGYSPISSLHYSYDASVPDTLTLLITEVTQIKDSARYYNLGPWWPAIVKQDTIGMLQLFRKDESKGKKDSIMH